MAHLIATAFITDMEAEKSVVTAEGKPDLIEGGKANST
jgi:hypothetical protein